MDEYLVSDSRSTTFIGEDSDNELERQYEALDIVNRKFLLDKRKGEAVKIPDEYELGVSGCSLLRPYLNQILFSILVPVTAFLLVSLSIFLEKTFLEKSMLSQHPPVRSDTTDHPTTDATAEDGLVDFLYAARYPFQLDSLITIFWKIIMLIFKY